MKNQKKGFTLVEVLIVVVIIAILASLIVPRMLMQTEKAKAAEAIQMIGAIKRAAERYYDFHGSYDAPSGTYIQSDPWGTPLGDWADLGLTGIEKSKAWKYVYYGFHSYLSVQAYDETATNWLAYVDANGSGIWICFEVFKAVEPDSDPNMSTKGCTI